jgi:hypothetical protein
MHLSYDPYASDSDEGTQRIVYFRPPLAVQRYEWAKTFLRDLASVQKVCCVAILLRTSLQVADLGCAEGRFIAQAQYSLRQVLGCCAVNNSKSETNRFNLHVLTSIIFEKNSSFELFTASAGRYNCCRRFRHRLCQENGADIGNEQ